MFPSGLRSGETYKTMKGDKRRKGTKTMQAIALEQHLRTKALEIFPTFIVGIELKDKNGREI